MQKFSSFDQIFQKQHMKKLFLYALVLCIISCKSNKKDAQNLLFEPIDATASNVNFTNTLTETEQWNIIQYLYFYNGGGVSVGDVNGDNLPDIYFTSNQGSNKLYINKGNFQFEDVTDKAGVADNAPAGNGFQWKTGTTMADVNGDGKLDIYVCHVSNYKGLTGKNRLFINKGDGTFTDEAARLGLDMTGLCTQAAFFDYDGDGDLDCYLLRHSVHSAGSYRPISARMDADPMAGDMLLKNYGGRFADVSKEAGIRDGSLGYGLGLAIGDLNGDGAPDIYVSNDFHDNDYLYYNNGNGTFTEGVTQSMGHNSNFSMGNDVADFNNDGRLDFVGLDMKPEEETILKASTGVEPYNVYDFKNKEFGYLFQFSRNMLQLNRGNLTPPPPPKGGSSSLPPLGGGGAVAAVASFSEIGQLAGVATTDWSWSSLLADLDNDGWKDLFITNGIMRRPNDLDYIKYLSNQEVQKNATDLALAKQMPDGKAYNYCFRNKGDLTFENVGEKWGLNQYGLSNGAAYADLDNDGDLDLVVNNINEKAFILKNKSEKFFNNNWLKIKLLGKGANTEGVGAKVIVYSQQGMQIQEQSLTRGFESSVESTVHFGFPNQPNLSIKVVDSLRVIWRDGSTQLLKNINVNQTLTLKQKEATSKWDFKKPLLSENLNQTIVFQDITSDLNLKYKHEQGAIHDFDTEKLLPHALCSEGPKIAVGDVNKDGLDDFFIGGATGQSGEIFIQNKNGNFTPYLLPKEKFSQTGAAFLYADDDKNLDLYVTCTGDPQVTTNRLYLNNGKGELASVSLESSAQNGSCVKPFDFDGDGDMDIFIGTRSDLNSYGMTAKSHLLKNEKGIFKDVTPQYFDNKGLIGMVTDAVWTDLNGDKRPDLVVVGEWMPITIFYNAGDHFEETDMENTSGWWNCVTAADMDNDGDNDLLLGNMGLNSNWQASRTQPMSLYVKDFDGNGDKEPIISYYRQGIEWCYNSKDELTAQMPELKKRFADYTPFSKSPFEKIFTKEMLKGAVKKQMRMLSSVYIENNGNGDLELKTLPLETQFSTVNAILVDDFDGDGFKDVALGGNFYEMQPSIGRFDASYGSILRGDGNGNWTPLSPLQTGFVLRGAVRDIKKVGNKIVIAANNKPLQIFEIKKLKKEKK